ncbi:hypothetical protein GCM10027578_26340 [Spirosoma luteolum]
MHDLTPFRLIIDHTSDQEIRPGKATRRLRMSITFADLSVLHVRENYVLQTGWVDYAYHWQAADGTFLHRWDNAHSVDVPTSPHHQHVGSEGNVQPATPMTLSEVLAFIATRLISD